eukprot:IDg3964t1
MHDKKLKSSGINRVMKHVVLDNVTDEAIDLSLNATVDNQNVQYSPLSSVEEPLQLKKLSTTAPKAKLFNPTRTFQLTPILSAADATDILLYLQQLLSELTYKHQAELTADSRSISNLIFTTKEPAEALNRVDIAAMREAFSKGALQAISWCSGHYLVADTMTKDNKTSAALLLKALREGIDPSHPELLRKLSPNARQSLQSAVTIVHELK